jgi:hypothetical protein
VIALALILAAAAAEQSGSVTLPLAELVPLLNQKQAKEKKAPPPAPALITSATLRGRLHADSLTVTARIEVAVLADEWVEVPLLELGPDAMVSVETQADDATVAVRQGRLVLVAEQAGKRTVQANLTVRAAAKGAQRTATLPALHAVERAALQLDVDPAFEIIDPGLEGPKAVLLPRAGRFSVSWRAVNPAAVARKPVERPPLEPAAPHALATWVTTLEGQLELRVRYSLRLDRPQPFVLQLPEGARLVRALVNGRTVGAQPSASAPLGSRVLQLEAQPSDVGASDGSIEVVLSQELGVFHLSGALRLTMPRASWPIDLVEASAFLPAVFEYRREGGSLEADSRAVTNKALPGRAVQLKQHRVAASAPAVELSYSVDIEKSYFR